MINTSTTNQHHIETAILRRLADMSQTRVAALAGMSEGALSKWKGHDLEPTVRILAALGLTVVPADMEIPTPEYLLSIETLARMQLDRSAAARERARE